LARGQELGRNQGKAGRGAKNQRLKGLVFEGRGHVKGGSVDVDCGDDALYAPYTPTSFLDSLLGHSANKSNPIKARQRIANVHLRNSAVTQ
jgi:hypothetical protein